MKNRKRIRILLLAIVLGLLVMLYFAVVYNGKKASTDGEATNLGEVNEFTVDEETEDKDSEGEESEDGKTEDSKTEISETKVPDATKNTVTVAKGEQNAEGSTLPKPGNTVTDVTNQESKEVVLPKAGDKVDEYMTVSDVASSGNELSVTFANTSKVWEVGADSYVEFTYYDANGKRLCTQKIELGSVEPGSTATCKLTLPSETASVKVTGSDFDYWSIVVK